MDRQHSHAMVDLANGTDPDGLMPTQWEDRHRLAAPSELRLMATVMSDAVRDYRRRGAGQPSRARYLAQLAKQWIDCRDRSWPYSFENICAVFDVDPLLLRRQLERERALDEAPPLRVGTRRNLVLTGPGPNSSHGRGPRFDSRRGATIPSREVA